MLKIRLQRTGRKHETTFRIVVTESQNSTKSGRTLQVLGSYDPRKKTEVIDADRVKHWMSKGAQVSGTMHNLLLNHKIIEGKKINVLPKKKPVVSEEAKKAAEAAAAAAAAPKEEAPAAAVPAEAVDAEAPAESA